MALYILNNANLKIINESYCNIKQVLLNDNVNAISGGVILDVGASYHQLTSDKRGFSLGSFGTPTGQGEIMFGSSYDQAVSGRECERKGKRVIYSGHHS